MICPHCNQEHPEGTKFCPMTGERIINEQLISCKNDGCANFGRSVIPIHNRFCPECGSPLGTGYLNMPYSNRKWSTREDFKHGNVIVNGIMLGGAYPIDFLQSIIAPYKEGSIAFVPITKDSYALLPLDIAREESLEEKFSDKYVLDDEFANRATKAVEWMQVSYDDFPLFRELGVKYPNEKINNIEILEANGYFRIRNFLKFNQNNPNYATLVSERENHLGGYTFLVLFEEYMYVFNNIVTEWKSFSTGETYYPSN